MIEKELCINENQGFTAGVGPRHYLDGLYATLKYLKPKYCLEIGTNHGKSARIFQRYFDEYMPDGQLITCDIKSYGDLSELKNVVFCQVYPHVSNIKDWHYVTDEEMLDPIVIEGQTGLANVDIISEIQNEFDFAFIDGDHQKNSVDQDLLICQHMLKAPQYILLDDTEDYGHEVANYFQNELRNKYNCYDFSDWNANVGAALLWNK